MSCEGTSFCRSPCKESTNDQNNATSTALPVLPSTIKRHKRIRQRSIEEMAELLEDKGSSGCSPSPTTNSRPTSPNRVNGLKGSLRIRTRAISIGKSSVPSPPKSLLPRLEAVLEPSMLNLLNQTPRRSIAGKTIPASARTSGLNLGASPSNATIPGIGKQYGPPPSPGISSPFLQTLEWY